MSDTLLAVLLGGGIAILPNLVLVFMERWKQHSQQKHEIRMKQIELYEVPRQNAINGYMECLGLLMADFYHPDDLLKYFAAYEKAALYVSKETRELMLYANCLVKATWMQKGGSGPIFTLSPKIEDLNNVLYEELRLSLDKAEKPSRRRAKENHKKDVGGK